MGANVGYRGVITVAKAKSLTAPGMYRADPTLYLRIAPSGAKHWIQRLTIDGRRHDLGLGGFPLVSLVEAREQAFENRRKVRTGGNPLAEKRRANVPTFREATARTCEALRPRWGDGKHAADWTSSMERYAFPILGDLRVDRIQREDVLRMLTPIWGRKLETARRVRQRVRSVLRWAHAHGYVGENMAGEALDGALPSLTARKSHFRALPYREVPRALETVRESPASLPARLCFEFLVLTAARSGEARNATWAEMDTEAREWRIPGERMKGGREHRVPLPDAALDLLEQARGAGRWERAGVPVTAPGRPSALRHDPDETASGSGACGPDHGARDALSLPGLVRGDGEAAGDCRGRAGSHRWRRRGRLLPE